MFNCVFCSKECKNKNSFVNHQRLCKLNPNRQISPIIEYNRKKTEGLVKSYNGYTSPKNAGIENWKPKKCSHKIIRKPLSLESKEKISTAMKTAHAEGRAWNIGKSRWNNEPSYPEKFFMKVIENNFEDKSYTREYSFGRYSLDFAWIDKRKCIEIDGDQHERFEDYKSRDISKDELLKQNGWEVLRIKWKHMYNNPKDLIKVAYDFIHYDTINKEYLDRVYIENQESLKLKIESLEKAKELKLTEKRNIIQNKIENIEKLALDFKDKMFILKISEVISITPQKVKQWLAREMPKFYSDYLNSK